jgi:hypothetical protein
MPKRPVDLTALQESAAKTDSPYAVVSRRWLASVARELAECRAAKSVRA